METNEAVRIEADLAKSQALAEREHAATLVVTNPEEYRVAVAALKECSSKHREVEAMRKRATAPLDEAKRTIMDWFRPAVDNLTSAIGTIRKAIAKYEADQKKREAEAAAKYAIALPTEKAEAKAELVRAFEGSVEKIDGVTKKTIWRFEIVEPTLAEKLVDEIIAIGIRTPGDDVNEMAKALDKIDKLARQLEHLVEYLVPNEKAIGALVRQMKQDTVIPGVRVYAETSLAVSGGEQDHE